MEKIKKYILVLYIVLYGLLPSTAAVAEDVKITLLSFADIYNANIMDDGGGLSSLEPLLNIQKSNNDNSFILVSGDILSVLDIQKKHSGRDVIDILNKLGVDIVTFGNHEFSFDIEELMYMINESKFKWLASNIYTKSGKLLPKVPTTIVIDVKGIKVGFFAICLPEKEEIYPNYSKLLEFRPVMSSALKAIKTLRNKKADIIVALTHLNLDQDIALAECLPEINVILGGHDHKNISMYINNTLIHKSGTDGKFIGKVDIIARKRKGIVNVYPSWSTIINPTVLIP